MKNKMIINIILTIISVILLIVFGSRTLNGFGFKYVPKIPVFFGEFSKEAELINGGGGKGGNASANGINSTAIGGPGGGGGPNGIGGAGGDANASGDNSFAAGGEGGEAGQLDRGGRGGRSGYEVAGFPNFQLPDGTWMYDYGRGGNGVGLSTSTSTTPDKEGSEK